MKTCEWTENGWRCDKPVEGKTLLCASHGRMVRKSIMHAITKQEQYKQLLNKPKKIYKAPNKVSPKRAEQNKEYAILREEFLKEHTTCELKLQGCQNISTQVHHTASGWNKATNLNNVKTWKASCDHCNQFLHDKISAQEARNLGLKI